MASRRPDVFALRARRLAQRRAACDRPILWLCGMAGTGKSRWLQEVAQSAVQRGATAPALLDDPPPRALRAALAALKPGQGAPVALIVASGPTGEIADLLLEERLYGRVAVWDDGDLFVSAAECRRSGVPDLYDRTGGWPMLVDAALAGRGDEAQQLLPVFLRTRVLPALPEPLAAALLGTALMTALMADEAPALDAFLDEAPAHPLLARDPARPRIAGTWTAAALQQVRAGGALPPAIAARLAAFHARHAQPVDAIVALVSLGLRDEALALYEQSGGVFFGFRHGFAALGRVLQAFGANRENQHESLLLARIFLLFKTGQAREALRRLDAHFPRLPVDLRRLQTSHRVYAILLRIDIAVDLDEGLTVALVTSWGRLDAFLPPEDHLARGILFNTMALGFLRTDALVPARQLAEEAVAAFERAQSPYLVHFMLIHLADIALRQGRLHAVAEHLRRAGELLRQSGLMLNSEQAILQAFEARLAYEEGRLDDCPASAEPILAALVGGDCWPGLIRTIMGYAPFVAYWRGGLGAAIEAAEQCMLALGRRHGPTEDHGLGLVRIRLHQMARRHAEALERLRELELDAVGRRSVHEAAEEQVIRLRAQALSHAQPAPALEAALDTARALAGQPELTLRQRISTNLLQAFLRHRLGEQGPARRHLLLALRAAQAHGCTGVLLEDAEILERLLPGLVAEAGADDGAVRAYAGRVTALLRRLPGTGLRSRAAGVTRQEHRILLQLAEGGTNKEIARVLALSESAVKFHLRNLFRKFKVTRRVALLERARAGRVLS